MEVLNQLLNSQLGFASIMQYIGALSAIILAMILRKIVFIVFLARIKKWTEKTESNIDDMIIKDIDKPLGFLFMLIGVFVACVILDLPVEPVNVKKFTFLLLKSMFVVNICWFLLLGTDVLSMIFDKLAAKTESKLDDQMVPLVRKGLKFFLLLITFVIVIQNLGYSISTLLAGLGIGGLAFALAAKDTVSNLFGSLTIFLDNPFQIGDRIEVGGVIGNVEEVGFRSTKIRTLEKTQISIPNSMITNMVINNISKRPQRRIKFNIGVTYETSPDKLEESVNTIRKILIEHPQIDKEKQYVYFDMFLDSALNISVSCYANTKLKREFKEIQQEVNLKIMRSLQELGVEMAYPTQTIYVNRV